MKKRHQHFIPKTYLKRFAHKSNGDSHFVSAYNKETSDTIEDMSIRDVCVEKDLYTFKQLSGDDKYKLEKFFSDVIETRYPKIYKTIVVDKKEFIEPEERAYILYTTLSLYFRTPKRLNEFTDFAVRLIEQIRLEKEPETINFLGTTISLKDKKLKELKNEIKENQRLDYVKTQLDLFNKFFEFNSLNGLMVQELKGEQEFITSDNPVEIRNIFDPRFNLFSDGNMVSIPLDPKHLLTVMPKNEGTILNKVIYKRDDFFLHVNTNFSTYQNAERWVIGTIKGLASFRNDLRVYNQPADENHPLLQIFEEKVRLMAELNHHIQNGISNRNPGLIEFLKALKNHKLFEEHLDIRDAYDSMKKLGLKI
ncbi:MAG: DUF4238 domain-containing protein [Cyclobacteriaceae bacterium]|nr:DUF4238 domain-containing protein [Cyclobacteriaceae bacterium]MCH8516864.1 DUF4238 domain-containing protein [Cyclobacteriaceae bacterium]